MTSPLKQNLTAIRGDEFSYPFRLQTNGLPIDLTGKVGVAEIRDEPTDPDPLTTMQVTVQGPQGRVVLFMPHTQTALLPLDKTMIYSVRLQNADGSDRRTWMQGALKVQALATR